MSVVSSFVRSPTANTEVFQCIRLLGSLQDAILNYHAPAQVRTPRIAVTTPMRHDCTLLYMVLNLASLLIVKSKSI